MKIFPSLLAAACLVAPAVRAQGPAAPALNRASAEASRILAASPLAGPVTRGRQTPDIDSDVEPKEALGNFHQVAPGFFRSAQPNKDGYAQLRQMGLKTILNLTGNADRERGDAGPEIKVESVPMSGFSAPTFEQMDQALDIVASAPRPLLVHCQFGKDRTGFVVAAYRVTVEKMDVDAAVSEAESYGCCFSPMGDLGAFLRDYAARRRAPARR
jgi:protein tyrosine phosphatase (PTP) superfamily phosphohydrolase (DUF442 family)